MPFSELRMTRNKRCEPVCCFVHFAVSWSLPHCAQGAFRQWDMQSLLTWCRLCRLCSSKPRGQPCLFVLPCPRLGCPSCGKTVQVWVNCFFPRLGCPSFGSFCIFSKTWLSKFWYVVFSKTWLSKIWLFFFFPRLGRPSFGSLFFQDLVVQVLVVFLFSKTWLSKFWLFFLFSKTWLFKFWFIVFFPRLGRPSFGSLFFPRLGCPSFGLFSQDLVVQVLVLVFLDLGVQVLVYLSVCSFFVSYVFQDLGVQVLVNWIMCFFPGLVFTFWLMSVHHIVFSKMCVERCRHMHLLADPAGSRPSPAATSG